MKVWWEISICILLEIGTLLIFCLKYHRALYLKTTISKQFSITKTLQHLPLSIKHRRKMKPCVSPSSHPLINKHRHILSRHRKNCLRENICTNQHVPPQSTANFLLCSIWSQRQLLIEHLQQQLLSNSVLQHSHNK